MIKRKNSFGCYCVILILNLSRLISQMTRGFPKFVAFDFSNDTWLFVKREPDAGGKMRMGNCGWKNADRRKWWKIILRKNNEIEKRNVDRNEKKNNKKKELPTKNAVKRMLGEKWNRNCKVLQQSIDRNTTVLFFFFFSGTKVQSGLPSGASVLLDNWTSTRKQ